MKKRNVKGSFRYPRGRIEDMRDKRRLLKTTNMTKIGAIGFSLFFVFSFIMLLVEVLTNG